MFPRSFSSSSSEKREKTTDFERAETKRIKKMFGRKMVEGGGRENRDEASVGRKIKPGPQKGGYEEGKKAEHVEAGWKRQDVGQCTFACQCISGSWLYPTIDQQSFFLPSFSSFFLAKKTTRHDTTDKLFPRITFLTLRPEFNRVSTLPAPLLFLFL